MADDPLEYLKELKETIASIPDEIVITNIAEEVAKKVMEEVERWK